MSADHYDIVVLGAGLAGLGLAKQILTACPQSRVLVVEKGRFPRPEAIAKVGESTVEIGSHYLLERLELNQYLNTQQIKKFGLRVFLGATGNIEQSDELGVSQVFGLPTYQIDRGMLENRLHAEVTALGGVVLENQTVTALGVGNQKCAHRVELRHIGGEPRQLEARWLVDASGRAGLLKAELNLATPSPHRANAVWFRVDRQVKIDQWSDDAGWHRRCQPRGERWRSTNHLTGPGYWVWVIPLASGATSIGIVMDDCVFEAHDFSTSANALAWLRHYQPLCAAALTGARFLDYVVLQHYAYDCRQVFSDQRWAITGEAGRFADPFYSPGTDFIAMANDFILGLVTKDLNGEDIRLQARLCDATLRAIYDNTLSLYVDQYGGFGDRVLLATKLLWDYAYYWGVLCLMYFDGCLAEIETLKRHSAALSRAHMLNQSAQAQFRKRAKQRLQYAPEGLFIDQYTVPCLRNFNDILASCEKNLAERHLENNIQTLQRLCGFVEDVLSDQPSTLVSPDEAQIVGRFRFSIRPELEPKVVPSQRCDHNSSNVER